MDHVIENQSDLDGICSSAAKMAWVGLDTEFKRERTYYPKLCLLQMSTSDTTVCVDTLADLDFSAFKRLLTNPDIVKIFHSARQDIEALYIAFDVSPDPLFDTQIAAQLCGYKEQISYAKLTQQVCSVALSKSHTRIDWSRRPLSESEILYALDDARYLGSIYRKLQKQLVTLGREDWVHEDCKRLLARDILGFGSSRAIEKIQYRARDFDKTRQSIAFELAVWREAAAQSRDLPREWVLRSDTIIVITEILPKNLQEFVQHPKLAELDCANSIPNILNAIELGKDRSGSYIPMKGSVRPTAKERQVEKVLWSQLETICSEANIPIAAVTSRKEIRSLARGSRDVSLLEGWREGFIGRELCDLILM